MSSSSSYPWLPTELIENIVFQVWFSPLSTDERITFMTSSPLVNKIWSTVFLRVSFKDVYIPCSSYYEQYFRILRKESPIFDEQTKSLPDTLCQSITLTVEQTPVYPALLSNCDEPAMGKVLSDLLYTLNSIPYVPNLRVISVEYLNTGFDDIFDNLRFISFPEQVTDLELNFTFTSQTPQWLVYALRRKQVCQGCIQWALPSIRRLSIKGGSEAMIADMVSACPEMDTLELDFPSTKLEIILPDTHLVNLAKGVAGVEEGNTFLPDTKLTISSGFSTGPSKLWEGFQTNRSLDVWQFRSLQAGF